MTVPTSLAAAWASICASPVAEGELPDAVEELRNAFYLGAQAAVCILTQPGAGQRPGQVYNASHRIARLDEELNQFCADLEKGSA